MFLFVIFRPFAKCQKPESPIGLASIQSHKASTILGHSFFQQCHPNLISQRFRQLWTRLFVIIQFTWQKLIDHHLPKIVKNAEIFGGRVATIEREGSYLRQVFNNHRSYLWISIPKPQRAGLKNQSSNLNCLSLVYSWKCYFQLPGSDFFCFNSFRKWSTELTSEQVIACVTVPFQWLMICHGFVKKGPTVDGRNAWDVKMCKYQ